MRTAFEIANRLAAELGGGVNRTGGQFIVRCPGHKDRTASLAIRDGDGDRIVFYCHAGCRSADVIGALRARGLWPGSEDRERHRVAPVHKAPRDDTAERRATALSLWRRRKPIAGALAEVYLRQHRGIGCALPATLGFLPANDRYPAALIAAFGMAHEPEPGVIAINDHTVTGVHLTKLAADGRKHPEKPNKIILGRCLGSPIVIAPMNDLLGLAVVEGIEEGLSIHEATGLGVWAAGSATRMPALTDAVPDYTDCVTVFADADKAGQRNAAELAERLNARGIVAEILPSGAAS